MDRIDVSDISPVTKRSEVVAYEAFVGHVRKMLRRQEHARHIKVGVDLDSDPQLAELVEMQKELAMLKDLTPGQVHINEVLTTMSLMYANEDFIGLQCMPEVFTGGSLAGTWFTYGQRDRMAFPDDTVGEGEEPNELNETRSTDTYALVERAFKEHLSFETLQNQMAPLNELIDLQESVLYGLRFKQEQRIVAAVELAGNYGANTTTVAAGDRWDTADGGDPGAVVDDAVAHIWSGNGPGILVAPMSLALFNLLRRHPRILDGFTSPNGASPKVADANMLARFFSVDRILIGKARQDTANIGQTATYARMWANAMSILRVANPPGRRNASWGYTICDHAPTQELFAEPGMGAAGRYKARSQFHDQQKVCAQLCGHRIITPMAA
jgi:hypothetical protein